MSMKLISKFAFMFLLGLMVVLAQPTGVKAAPPAFLFVFTTMTGGWAAVTYEDCKANGIDAEDCAKKVWKERTMDKQQVIGVLRSGDYGND